MVAIAFARNERSFKDRYNFGEAEEVACNHEAFRTVAITITTIITSFIDYSFIGVTLELQGLTS